jgi:outer membrane lipoprotein carrier protein
MKLLIISLLTCKLLLAFPIKLNSIEADFKQTIVDDHNKSIIYTGKLWAKKPAIAHWSYQKPVEKEIYMIFSKITIIEPDLEQVIRKDIGDSIDLIKIIDNSKKISLNHYLANYNGKKYHIFLDKDILKSLHYIDDFGNKTTIDFNNTIQNEDINESNFKIIIPEDYDLIN